MSKADKEYYQRNKDKAAFSALSRRYGLSEHGYLALLFAQHGTCAICHQTETARDRSGNVKPLSVDHDHGTGSVRGLLCHNCNQLLGLLEAIEGNSHAVIAEALAYLDRAPTKPIATTLPLDLD